MTAPGRSSGPVRRRSWLQVRLRQLRSAPPPVVRAVASGVGVAAVLGIAFLAYDVAISRGAVLPGGDLRALAGVLFVVVVAAGSWITYLVVPAVGPPRPLGAPGGRRRSGWNAALGLLAALPITYLALVVLFQVVQPLLDR